MHAFGRTDLGDPALAPGRLGVAIRVNDSSPRGSVKMSCVLYKTRPKGRRRRRPRRRVRRAGFGEEIGGGARVRADARGPGAVTRKSPQIPMHLDGHRPRVARSPHDGPDRAPPLALPRPCGATVVRPCRVRGPRRGPPRGGARFDARPGGAAGGLRLRVARDLGRTTLTPLANEAPASRFRVSRGVGPRPAGLRGRPPPSRRAGRIQYSEERFSAEYASSKTSQVLSTAKDNAGGAGNVA